MKIVLQIILSSVASEHLLLFQFNLVNIFTALVLWMKLIYSFVLRTVLPYSDLRSHNAKMLC